MSSKKKIVVFGGGGGIQPVIQGLKYLYDVTAVVSTSDNGGSTGELRNQGIIGIGDLRAALCAMAKEDDENQLVRDVFAHRFSMDRDVFSASFRQIIGYATEEMNYDPYNRERVINVFKKNLRNMGIDIDQVLNIPTTTLGQERKGHTVGNLVLCYLIMTNRDDWVDKVNRIFPLYGRVLPNTTIPCYLHVTFDSSRSVLGESFLDNPVLRLPPIKEFSLCRAGERNSEDIPADERVIDAINQSDVIVIAPGSFYASIISSLFPKGISGVIANSKSLLIVIQNLFYDIHQTLFRYPGPDGRERIETISPEEQMNILSKYAGRIPDLVIVQDPDRFPKDPDILERYKNELGIPSIMPEVRYENGGYTFGGVRAIVADLARLSYQDMRRGPGFVFRHDPEKIEETFRYVLAQELQ